MDGWIWSVINERWKLQEMLCAEHITTSNTIVQNLVQDITSSAERDAFVTLPPVAQKSAIAFGDDFFVSKIKVCLLQNAAPLGQHIICTFFS